MPELNPNLAIFRDSFDHFDTAAHGGDRDGIVSRADLRAVANDTSGKYSPQERAAARYLLDNGADFVMLDTAQERSCAYSDGRISREDVNTVFSRAPSYSAAATFVSEGCRIPSDTHFGMRDPVQAAAQTREMGQMAMGDRSAAVSHFMQVLREHQGDTRWLQDYFRALGSRNVAEYMSGAANAIRYSDRSPQDAHQQIALARDTLQQMYASGALNDADVACLVEQWATQPGKFNPGIAQLFAGLQGPESQHLQNAFFRATSELALAPNKGLGLEDRQSLAAAGTYVLAKTNADNQIRELTQIQSTGSGGAADVGRLITLAMSERTSVVSLGGQWTLGRPTFIDYNGVTQLVHTLSHIVPPDGRRPPDSWSFNYGQLTNLRDHVFYGASNGLDANRSRWQDDVTLKEGLSRIFMADYDRMIAAATAQSKAGLAWGTQFSEAFENFTQNCLFTQPSGALRDETSAFLIKRLDAVLSDIRNPTLSTGDFVRRYGADPQQMSYLVGGLTGHLVAGMEQAMQVATDKRAAQKAALEFGLNLAWALGKDLSKFVPGSEVIKTVLGATDTGGQLAGKGTELLKSTLVEKIANEVLKEFPDLKPDAQLNTFVERLFDTIPGDMAHNYKASMTSEYNRVIAGKYAAQK